jgi:hypothetical protein
MVIIRVGDDDGSYVSGDMECEVDKDGEHIEPYIFKEDNRIVECYVSGGLYIEKENNEITKVVHTGTCWSDDYDIYEIEDGVVVHLETTEHGMNRGYMTYGNGVISNITFARREFGDFAIGDLAPQLEELLRWKNHG